MQDRPFDGLAFKLNTKVTLAFENRRWAESEMHFDVLPQISWGRYTDNFILVWGQSDTPVDWFDDALWQTITENTRLMSRALNLSGAKGIIFDPEFYPSTFESLWKYRPELYGGRAFAEVEAQVRRRGSEFMQSLQVEKPDVRVLSLWAVAVAYANVGANPERLQDSAYALLPAFIYGILETMNENSVFIDGNEFAYPYDDTTEFAAGYQFIHQQTEALIPPPERDRYRQLVTIGASLYMDHILGLDGDPTIIASTEDRLRWLQHNIYHALLTADEYAWTWNERLNWWGYDLQNENSTPSAANISPEIIESINTGRRLYESGEKLGFDMQPGPDVTFVFLSEPQINFTTRSGATTFSVGELIEFIFQMSKDTYVFRIELLANSIKVGETNGRSLTVNNLAPGNYTLVARAFLTNGQHVSSKLLTIQVM
jgi:hypothetical protein